jgi:exopolysaccharide biosynthesis polyprenyl glycosylphosphotransferase
MATLLTSGVRHTPAVKPVQVVAPSGRLSQRRFVRLLVVLDSSVIALAMLSGWTARFRGTGGVTGTDIPYHLLSGAIFVAWVLMLRLMRCYDHRVLGHGADEYRRVVGASLRLAGAIAISLYILDLPVSRGYLALSFLAGTVGLPVTRWIARKSLHRARMRGDGWSRNVLVVGDPPHVLELVDQLRREPYSGYRVVGACIPDALTAPVPQHLDGVPVVGSFRTILEAAAASGADTVAVTGSGELTARRLRRLGWQLEDTNIDLVLAPALTDVAGPRIHTTPIAGLPLIHVEAPEFSGGKKILKDLVDRTLALGAVLVFSPVLLFLAAAVKFTSKGPVFFRQTRVGRRGKEFGVYKFRSMVTGADKLVDRLNSHNETDGLMFKMKRDPRVTPIGRFLRRYSLDELPQLLNVLFGHMSLVGPRPPLPNEVARYDSDVARRLLVKPGMTGLWQVSGRSDLSWEDGIRLDLYYVENWSLATDVMIMWRTVGAVLKGRGAY